MRVLEKIHAPVIARIVLTVLLVSTLSLASVSAHLGAPVNSAWATVIPTIDGSISSGEWTDATILNVVLEMRSRLDGSLVQTLDVTLYFKNDVSNIYAAAQIFNEDYDDGGGCDGFGLMFDDHDDGSLTAGENGIGMHNDGGTYYHNNDLYYSSSPPTAAFGNSDSFYDDTGAGKTEDGAMAWSHSDAVEEHIGTWTFEMEIPLVGTDGDDYDLAVTTLPYTVGFKIVFFELEDNTDGVYPDDLTNNYNGDEWDTDGTSYGDLMLGLPGPVIPEYPMGTIAGVITLFAALLSFGVVRKRKWINGNL